MFINLFVTTEDDLCFLLIYGFFNNVIVKKDEGE